MNGPFADRAANDRAPREKRPAVERLANFMGTALVALYLASIAGLIAALILGSTRAAWLFLGAMLAAGTTLILVSIFERRLNP